MPFDEDNSYKDRLSGVVGFDPISDSEELARPGPKSAAQTPAPPKERIKGSKENPKIKGQGARAKSIGRIKKSIGRTWRRFKGISNRNKPEIKVCGNAQSNIKRPKGRPIYRPTGSMV